MARPTSVEMAPELVIVDGLRRTRGTFTRWRRDPGAVLRPWLLGALTITVLLLVAVRVVAGFVVPDGGQVRLYDVAWHSVFEILRRNSLVLALHAMACVAGFIAGSSLPLEAERHSGLWRKIHDHAGPLAIAFVVGATTFSLVTQAYVLGSGVAAFSAQSGWSATTYLLCLLPHAVPELVALFLPLAAWTIASRSGRWDELLAATFATVAIAVPILVAAAIFEVFVTPSILMWVSGL